MGIPIAAAATFGGNYLIARADEVLENKAATGVQNRRAWRDLDHQVRSASAVTISAAARLPAGCLPVPPKGKGRQGVDSLFRTNNYGTSVSAIATVRTTARHELFTAKADRSIPAATAFNEDSHAIDKHNPSGGRKKSSARGATDDAPTTELYRPAQKRCRIREDFGSTRQANQRRDAKPPIHSERTTKRRSER